MIALPFSAVFPILVYMAIGLALKKRGLFRGETPQEMNKLVFKLLLPLSIFESIYNTDMSKNFDLRVTAFVAATCIAAYIIISWVVKRKCYTKNNIPVIIQGIHKSNYNLLAVSIVSSFYGKNIGTTAILTAIITPIVNTCSTIAFESSAAEKRSRTTDFAIRIIKNPMVISSLLGIGFKMLRIPLPDIIINVIIKKLASAATPIAMLALGATIKFSDLREDIQLLSVTAIGKLIIMPAIIILLAVIIGIRGADLIAITVYSAAPTAINSYSTAAAMGGNAKLAGEIVISTSVLSILTLFIWLCLLCAGGLI